VVGPTPSFLAPIFRGIPVFSASRRPKEQIFEKSRFVHLRKEFDTDRAVAQLIAEAQEKSFAFYPT